MNTFEDPTPISVDAPSRDGPLTSHLTSHPVAQADDVTGAIAELNGDTEGMANERSPPEVATAGQPRRLVIVEPALALFVAAYVPSQTLISQFVYALVSSRHNLTEVIAETGQLANGSSLTCVDSTADADPVYDLQQEVQNQSAKLMMVLEISANIPAIITVLFYGAYSDKIGRKLPMTLPLLGQLVKCAIFIVTLYFRLPIKLLMVGCVIEGISGGMTTMVMSCMAYLADVCDRTRRTVRLTAIEVTCGTSAALAQVAMGYGVAYLGYMYPFYAVMIIHAINLGYVTLCVPEMRKPHVRISSANATPSDLVDQKDNGLRFGHVTRVFRLYSGEGGSGIHWKRLLLLLALLCCDTNVVGRWDPLTLYLLNSPLCWAAVLIGGYMAWTAVCCNLGAIALVASLHGRLHDNGLAILGCVSAVAYFLLIAFCTTTWSMFLVVPVGMAGFVPVTMLRAMNSKITPPDQQGALFSGLAAVDTLCSLMGSVVFNPIYGATLLFMKGFVFIVMAMIQLLGLVFIIILTFRDRRSSYRTMSETDVRGYDSIN